MKISFIYFFRKLKRTVPNIRTFCDCTSQHHIQLWRTAVKIKCGFFYFKHLTRFCQKIDKRKQIWNWKKRWWKISNLSREGRGWTGNVLGPSAWTGGHVYTVDAITMNSSMLATRVWKPSQFGICVHTGFIIQKRHIYL